MTFIMPYFSGNLLQENWDAITEALNAGPSGPVTTDDVTNESSVAGATATDALNTLSTSDGIANASDPFLGPTVTDAITSLETLVNAIPAPTLPPSTVSFHADGSAIGVGAAFTLAMQIDGSGSNDVTLNPGITVGQMVIVLLNTAGGSTLHTAVNDYLEDGSSLAPAASVFLVWTGGQWNLVASQGVTVS